MGFTILLSEYNLTFFVGHIIILNWTLILKMTLYQWIGKLPIPIFPREMCSSAQVINCFCCYLLCDAMKLFGRNSAGSVMHCCPILKFPLFWDSLKGIFYFWLGCLCVCVCVFRRNGYFGCRRRCNSRINGLLVFLLESRPSVQISPTS